MFAALLPALMPILSKILELIPDGNAKAKAQADFMAALMQASSEADKAQLAVNQAEAANPSLFVAGWRPFIGWICGLAVAYQYLVRPMIAAFRPDLIMPGLDGTLWELMFGMLGIGGLRSFEKVRGVETPAVAIPFARPAPRQMAGVTAGMVVTGG